MNHTIKGIILVAVLMSMLVVGATTMFPIMQNSFAYKKSAEDRQAVGLPVLFPGVPGGNTNTNANSADSSSDSSATAENTNNINNSACAVAVTCPKGSTTVTSSTTGTLLITKVCNGCLGAFVITVTGNNPQPSSFTLKDLRNEIVHLGPGSFTVHESVPTRFHTPVFGGDCKQTAPGFPDATGTISAGQALTCVILNH